jgi:hypothetical protein
MPITYPLSIPTTPGAAGLERFVLSGAHAVGVLRSPFTFMTQVQAHPGEAWMLEASVAPCRKEQAEPWVAFFASLRGPTGTFLIGDPNRATPLGAATGAPKVSGANAVRATSLNTKGWTNSVTNILRAGDYIQIGQRLYKVLQSVNSSGTGTCTLDIFPALRETLTDNTTIITSSPKGLFRLNTPEIELFEVDKERLYGLSFSAVEAL